MAISQWRVTTCVAYAETIGTALLQQSSHIEISVFPLCSNFNVGALLPRRFRIMQIFENMSVRHMYVYLGRIPTYKPALFWQATVVSCPVGTIGIAILMSFFSQKFRLQKHEYCVWLNANLSVENTGYMCTDIYLIPAIVLHSQWHLRELHPEDRTSAVSWVCNSFYCAFLWF